MEEIKKFGHYEIHSELGRGGMAIVYKCWEDSLQRFVAIKVLASHLANNDDTKERFFREAKSMAAISHPNVINVYFIGEEQGSPYFSMEYIEGQSLSELLQHNRALDVRHAINILSQACEGLQAAHEKGLIHRDIKPGNILLSENGFLKLMDFGIAQSNKFDTTLTQTGEIIGTPGYLSPEICIGEKVDIRSDIYSLGIVFYQMLAGDVPFDTSTPYKLLKDIVESDIGNIQKLNKKVDDKTASILLKMIEKNPEDRYKTCQDVLNDLGKVEKNTDLKTIINHSKVNSKAKEKTTMSFQLTQISQAGSKVTKQKNKVKIMGLITSVLVFLVLVYFISSQNPSQNSSSIPITDDLHNTNGINSELANVTPNQNCLEIGEVSFLNQKSKKWSFKRNDTPDDDLLKLIRSQLISILPEDKQLIEQWQNIKKTCLEDMQRFQLSIMITSYKKDTNRKVISKIGLGKEKSSLILTLNKMSTNSVLASKEIETKNISQQLKGETSDSEFIESIKLFLDEAI